MAHGISLVSTPHSQELSKRAQARRQKKPRHLKRPAEDVLTTTKGLQERTQLLALDDDGTCK